MKKILVLITLFTFLSGCSMLKDAICDVPITDYDKPPLELDDIDPLDPEKVEFIVITEENAADIFKALREKGIDPVLIGLTDNAYEALSKNYAKITIIIQKQRDQIEAYKIYYESPEKDDDK